MGYLYDMAYKICSRAFGEMITGAFIFHVGPLVFCIYGTPGKYLVI